MQQRLQYLAAAGLVEDAWGPDEPADEPAAVTLPSVPDPRPARSAGASTSGKAPPRPTRQAPPVPTVHTLQALCLGCLGHHLDDVVDALGEHITYLPPQARASLLTVARRTGTLTRRTLLALVDDTWTLLDLAGCTRLSDAALQAAVQQVPALRFVDLGGCSFHAGSLKALARCCPLIEVLRLGGDTEQDEAFADVLKSVLPQWRAPTRKPGTGAGGGGPAAAARVVEEAVEDSWEELSIDEVAGAAPAEPGRLNRLQAVVWPSIPRRAVEIIHSQCPRVAINPRPPQAPKGAPFTGSAGFAGVGAAGGFAGGADRGWEAWSGAALDPGVALDEGLARGVGGEAWRELAEGAAARGAQELVPISERFRMAYIDQANRVKARDKRLWQQQERRQLRSSQALQVMHSWLDEE